MKEAIEISMERKGKVDWKKVFWYFIILVAIILLLALLSGVVSS